MTKPFNFSARLYAAAATCFSKEETRYYLNGVHVEPHPEGGCLLVATDGHVLAVMHDEEGYAPASAILRCEETASIFKAKRGEKQDRRFQLDPGDPFANVMVDDETVDKAKFTTINGTFPDWRRVVPPTHSLLPGHACFNPVLLAPLLKTAADLQKGSGAGVYLNTSKDKGGPATIRLEGVPNCMFVIMPMKGNGLVTTPDWVWAKEAA